MLHLIINRLEKTDTPLTLAWDKIFLFFNNAKKPEAGRRKLLMLSNTTTE